MMSISFNVPSHNQDTTESTFLYQVKDENEKDLSARAIQHIRQRPPPSI